MFKDSNVTRLSPWGTVEEADALPAVAFPAFVGSGPLGIGLDAGGLQSLTESLGDHYHCPVLPFHHSQADLYVLHEGMVSSHLWDDEMLYTGAQPEAEHARREAQRNYLPLGWLDQSFEFDTQAMPPGQTTPAAAQVTLDGSQLRREARAWRREWSLREALVTTSFDLGSYRRFRVEYTAFAPHGGESLYLRFHRSALASAAGACQWTLRVPLRTRHGLGLFDPTDDVRAGTRTVLAFTGPGARHAPVERYAVLYGVAADGAACVVEPGGLAVTVRGPLAQEQSAWIRLDFHRCTGPALGTAAAQATALETELAAFTRTTWDGALARHRADFAAFWARTGEIEVSSPEFHDTKRAFLLHMSSYLSRCGNDYGLGGNVQYLLMHQNGWRACAFHDQHYILDGLLRINLWAEAEAHLHWMHRIMRSRGRPFPWMVTYDGFSPVPPELDRAPMSDANRALLAIRMYEYAGRQRERLLRDHVYPIVRAVAEHAVSDWFYRDGDHVLFRPVECDVMHDEARISEPGTLAVFLAVLRKAVAYSARLNVDGPRRAAWQAVVDGAAFERGADGLYRAWNGAPAEAAPSTWFLGAAYIAEYLPWLDAAALRATRDRFERRTPCNFVWLNSIAAATEIRLGRPDRAEQFMAASVDEGVHGPGYFEECVPNGISSLPPFATAHGSFLTAACEQVVLSDLWQPRVAVGLGLPSRLRQRTLHFRNLRARGGLLVSGTLAPREAVLELHQDGEPQELEMQIRLPAAVGPQPGLSRDGVPLPFTFGGETLSAVLPLAAGERTRLVLAD